MKRDANDLEIFRALKAAHCQPVRGTDCDIFCRSRADMGGMLLEVKVPGSRNRLRPIQRELKEIFGPRYKIVTSVQEALQAVGVA